MTDNREAQKSPNPSRWSWPTVAWVAVAAGSWAAAQWQFTDSGRGTVHVVASTVLVLLSLTAGTVSIRRLQRAHVLSGTVPPRLDAGDSPVQGRYTWRPPSTFTRRPQPAWFWLVFAATSVVTAVLRFQQDATHRGTTVLLLVIAAAVTVVGVRRLRRP
jgi:hypothetical protein